MIAWVDAVARFVCDWCYTRAPKPESPAVARSGIPVRPPRWGIGRRGDEYRHACPRHTRQLRAWERGDA